MADQKLKIKVEATGVNTTRDKFKKMSDSTDTATKSFASMAAGIVSATAILYSVKTAIGSVITSGGDFEQSLANLSAITGSTGKELKDFEKQAKALGATSVFTAGSIAGLQTELGKLGFPTDDILNMTTGISDLSAAIGTDLGETASIVGATMNQFFIDAEDTDGVIDAMAASFSQSALDLDKFTNSMTYVGPIAATVGVTLEATTGVLGVLANAGIDGSMAGTALKSVFLDLGNSTSKLGEKLGYAVTDNESLTKALEDLSEATWEEGEMLDLVGKRALPAFQILLSGKDKVGELTEAFENSAGTAEMMANVQLDTLQGKMRLMESATEGLAISLFERMSPGLQAGVEVVNDLIGSITSWVEIPISETMKEDQVQMNALFGILERTNISEETRKGILNEINTSYGEYLPYLLTEKSSIDDLTTARNTANEAFLGALILQANEEALKDIIVENAGLMDEYRIAMEATEVARNNAAEADSRMEQGLREMEATFGRAFTAEEALVFIAERDADIKERNINVGQAWQLGQEINNQLMEESVPLRERQNTAFMLGTQLTDDNTDAIKKSIEKSYHLNNVLYDTKDAEYALMSGMDYVTEKLGTQQLSYDLLAEKILGKNETVVDGVEDVKKANEEEIESVEKVAHTRKGVSDKNMQRLHDFLEAEEDARRLQILEAEGLYKTLIDLDDFWHSEKVQNLLDYGKEFMDATMDIADVGMDILKARQDALDAEFENEVAALEEANDLRMEMYDAQLEAGEELLEAQLEMMEERREAELDQLQNEIDNMEKALKAFNELQEAEMELLEEKHEIAEELEKQAMEDLEEQHKRALELMDEELDQLEAAHDKKRELMDDEMDDLRDLHDLQDDLMEDAKIAMDNEHRQRKRDMEDRHDAELDAAIASGATSEELKALKELHADEEKDFRREVEDDKVEYAAKKLEESRKQEEELAKAKERQAEEERKMRQETASYVIAQEKLKRLQDEETERLRIEQALAEDAREEARMQKEKDNDARRAKMMNEIFDKEEKFLIRKETLLQDEIDAKEAWATTEASLLDDKMDAEVAFQEEMLRLETEQKAAMKDMQRAQIVMSTATAAINAVSSLSLIPIIGPPLAAVAALLIVKFGADQLAALDAAAEGGLLGGRPHTQGGTIIEAEKGEFVINKESVDAFGPGFFAALNDIKNEQDAVRMGAAIRGGKLKEGGWISQSSHDDYKATWDDAHWWNLISDSWWEQGTEILANLKSGGPVRIAPKSDDFGGGMGSGSKIVNISITAPLLDEHVVDEIIPRLDEAFRRGETFTHLK